MVIDECSKWMGFILLPWKSINLWWVIVEECLLGHLFGLFEDYFGNLFNHHRLHIQGLGNDLRKIGGHISFPSLFSTFRSIFLDDRLRLPAKSYKGLIFQNHLNRYLCWYLLYKIFKFGWIPRLNLEKFDSLAVSLYWNLVLYSLR